MSRFYGMGSYTYKLTPLFTCSSGLSSRAASTIAVCSRGESERRADAPAVNRLDFTRDPSTLLSSGSGYIRTVLMKLFSKGNEESIVGNLYTLKPLGL